VASPPLLWWLRTDTAARSLEFLSPAQVLGGDGGEGPQIRRRPGRIQGPRGRGARLCGGGRVGVRGLQHVLEDGGWRGLCWRWRRPWLASGAEPGRGWEGPGTPSKCQISTDFF
jgi:hypothetical protein